jgi:phosphotransferase system enzyme I (PtsI)
MSKETPKECIFPGTAATTRSILGVVRLVRQIPIPSSAHLEVGDVRSELTRFDAALGHSREQLEVMRNRGTSEEAITLLDGQLLILADPELVGGVVQHIKTKRKGALRAVDRVIDALCQKFVDLDDEYLRAREADLQDVGMRIRKNLIGVDPNELEDVDAGTVLVARDLPPSSVVRLESVAIGGIVMSRGAATSHAAILARGLGLPCLVGVKGIFRAARKGDPILVDGMSGKAILHPSEATRAEYEKTQVQPERPAGRSLSPNGLRTPDGKRIHLRANISLGGEVRSLDAFGAEGVGLFRTEMIFLGRARAPSLDSQIRAYRRVLQHAGDRVVTFRTLDAGGDKDLPFLSYGEQANPAMGVRSIRLCLREGRVFRRQLKAILCAGAEGNARVMYPMISTLQELEDANQIMAEVKADLEKEGVEYARDLKAGMMIETPAAALQAERFAPLVEFFSIGTNDLMQFLFAADRGNPDLNHLQDGAHPACFGLLKGVINAGREAKIPVSCCGELPADPIGFLILLGLGMREFSMNLFAVPLIREIASKMDTRDLEGLMAELMAARDAKEVRLRLQEHLDQVLGQDVKD